MASAMNGGPEPRISSRRAARMYRLVTTLAKGSRSRADLVRLARAGMRTFYRDLTLLEECRIHVHLMGNRYRLDTPMNEALGRLPFPAPRLSFSDVIALSKGRGTAQAKLKAQFNALTR